MNDRLDEIDATLRDLQGRLPVATDPGWACTDDLTQELLRTSLDSLLVQRIWLVADDGVQACGPQGAGSVGELPPMAGAALALVSLRSPATELVVTRRLPDARLLVAKLDPRAMSLPANGPWDGDGGRVGRITLHSSDQRALRVWESAASRSAPMASLRVHLRSDRHGHAVSVELDRRVFDGRLMGQWPVARGCSGRSACHAADLSAGLEPGDGTFAAGQAHRTRFAQAPVRTLRATHRGHGQWPLRGWRGADALGPS